MRWVRVDTSYDTSFLSPHLQVVRSTHYHTHTYIHRRSHLFTASSFQSLFHHVVHLLPPSLTWRLHPLHPTPLHPHPLTPTPIPTLPSPTPPLIPPTSLPISTPNLPPSESLLEAEHLVDVIFHFERYSAHSLSRLHRLTSDFQSIDPSLQRLVPTFIPRMQELHRLTLLNQSFLRLITSHRSVFQSDPTINYPLLEHRRLSRPHVDEEKMSKVRSTLRQCVRDWSKEGEKERSTCYTPILRELERLWPVVGARAGVRVLVPGSGLGRLVWEVAVMGFFAQGNEFSYFMLLASYLILNESKGIGQWSIYPHVHETRNVMKGEDMMRKVLIPDVDVSAGVGESGGRFSMVAGDFMDVYSEEGKGYRDREKEMKQNSINAAYAAATASTPPPHPVIAPTLPHPTSDSDSDSDDSPPSPTASASSSPSASPSSSQRSAWDCVATCYFIDCSNNILETLRTISYLLRPGGYWLHFGPLLYHYSDMEGEMSVELTYEEVKVAMIGFGLKVVGEKTNRQSGYCVDERSMQRGYFYCVELTAQKVGGDTTRGEDSGVARKKTRRGKGKKARGKQEKRQGNG